MKNKSKERKNTKKAGLSLKLNRICQTSLLLGKYSAFGCFCGVLFSGRTFPLTWGGQFSSGVGEPAGHPGGGALNLAGGTAKPCARATLWAQRFGAL